MRPPLEAKSVGFTARLATRERAIRANIANARAAFAAPQVVDIFPMPEGRPQRVLNPIAVGVAVATVGIASLSGEASSQAQAANLSQSGTVERYNGDTPSIEASLRQLGLRIQSQGEDGEEEPVPVGDELLIPETEEEITSQLQSEPIPQPEGPPAPGTILLSENFDDPNSRVLPTSSDSRIIREYTPEGEYRLARIEPIASGVARVELPISSPDFSVAIDMRFVGDGERNKQQINLAVRKQQTSSSDYRVWINEGGQFGLIRFDNGSLGRRLASGTVPADLVRSNGNNRLELGAFRDIVYFRVNGRVVAVEQDSTYQSGQAWIGVYGDNVPVEARFDNLVVTALDPVAPAPQVEIAPPLGRYELVRGRTITLVTPDNPRVASEVPPGQLGPVPLAFDFLPRVDVRSEGQVVFTGQLTLNAANPTERSGSFFFENDIHFRDPLFRRIGISCYDDRWLIFLIKGDGPNRVQVVQILGELGRFSSSNLPFRLAIDANGQTGAVSLANGPDVPYNIGNSMYQVGSRKLMPGISSNARTTQAVLNSLTVSMPAQ